MNTNNELTSKESTNTYLDITNDPKRISDIIGANSSNLNPTHDHATISAPSTSGIKRSANNEPYSDSEIKKSIKITTSNNNAKDSSSQKSETINAIDNLTKNRYAHTNQGPFYVYIQSSSSPPSPIHPLYIGRTLTKWGKNDFTEVKKLGFSKISVKLKTKEAANLLISQQPFKDRSMSCFIPNYRIFRQGIIRNIPTDIDLEDLKTGIDCPTEITALRRLNRRVSIEDESGGKSTQFVPARTIVISFLNQILPKYIYIFGVRYEVTPFIPKTTICYSCYRFGHSATQCRGKPRCAHCGRSDHDNSTSCPNIASPPFCANCRGEHSPMDPLCPEFAIQKNVQLLAADRNIPLKEARDLLSGKNQNFNLRNDIFNFPPLGGSPSPDSPPSFSHFSSPIFRSSPYTNDSPVNYNNGISYAQATDSSNSYNNKTNKSPFSNIRGVPTPKAPNRPNQDSRGSGHDYLLEPNGRSLFRPPDGCAIPSERPNINHPPSPPSDSQESQLNFILQLFTQLIATVSNINPSLYNILINRSSLSYSSREKELPFNPYNNSYNG
ncbi:uncharacterized protein [Linepithema humile]|uniref:uncharacterized protein n=1 Tax=Linepithema humile TaxID=83485 RepID=UPI00351F5354